MLQFLASLIGQLKMLVGVFAFALGLVRWYQTPEAKALIASIK